MVLVVHPAGSHYHTSIIVLDNFIPCVLTRKLLRKVLVVLVAVLVEANEGTSLSITCTLSAHCSSRLIFLSRTYRCAIRARVVGQSCLRSGIEAWGRMRTCIWWPYSYEERSISAVLCTEAAEHTYLEANLAQVAQRPHKCRHGGVVCLVGRVDQSCSFQLTMPSPLLPFACCGLE